MNDHRPSSRRGRAATHRPASIRLFRLPVSFYGPRRRRRTASRACLQPQGSQVPKALFVIKATECQDGLRVQPSPKSSPFFLGISPHLPSASARSAPLSGRQCRPRFDSLTDMQPGSLRPREALIFAMGPPRGVPRWHLLYEQRPCVRIRRSNRDPFLYS